jgi:transcriptional regulator with XRE-family HTH domain
MSWWEFVVKTAGTDNQSEIARKMGIAQPSVSQWKKSTPKLETVRQFAEAYNIPLIDAHIGAGFITEAEARVICDRP